MPALRRHAAPDRRGYGGQIDGDLLARTRAGLHDELGHGIIWPVYPEFAAKAGLAPSSYRWRTAEKPGAAGKFFDLEHMLQRSWAIYAARAEHRDAMIQNLGGWDKIAIRGGA